MTCEPVTIPASARFHLPEQVDAVEFCERSMRLPGRGGVESVPFSTEGWEHLREPLRALDDPAVKRVTLVWGSQCGKTTVLICALMLASLRWIVDTIWIVPGENLIGSLRRRLSKAIKLSPRWAAALMPGKRSIVNRDLLFRGMDVFLGTADSEADMSSRAAGLTLADEIDKFKAATKNEGSPLDQLRARMRTYPDGKLADTSTPTHVKGAVWESYLESDMRVWAVACPGCGRRSAWEWDSVEWEERPVERGLVEHAKMIARNPSMAWWRCGACKHQAIGQQVKDAMNRGGLWMGSGEDGDHAGFHLPSLASRFTSFHGLAALYLRALAKAEKGDDRKLKHFTIHELAKPYEAKKFVAESASIVDRTRADMPRGVVPVGAELVTGFCDVQHGRIYWTVCALWREGPRIAVVDHGWTPWTTGKELRDAIAAVRDHAARPRLVMVDSGDGNTTAEVYGACNRLGSRVRPSKGSDRLAGGRLTGRNKDPEADHRGKLMHLATIPIKDMWAAMMEQPAARGAVSFHAEASGDEDLQEQLVSEERVVERGRSKWKLREGYAQNHWFDCVIGCLAGACSLGMIRRPSRREMMQDRERERKAAAAHAANPAGPTAEQHETTNGAERTEAPAAAPQQQSPTKPQRAEEAKPQKAKTVRLFKQGRAAGF